MAVQTSDKVPMKTTTKTKPLPRFRANPVTPTKKEKS
jgi:hypothetical protein